MPPTPDSGVGVLNKAAAVLTVIESAPAAVLASEAGAQCVSSAARYQHMIDTVRISVAEQVDGLIWKAEANRPDGDDGAACALVPVN